MVSHSFEAFGVPSRGRFFIMNILGWAPEGFTTWMFERVKSPGMDNLRKNGEYGREVAAKLIEEKRQELKDGTSRKDLLSLLGPSCIPFMELVRSLTINCLVKASSTLRPEWRLNEEEMISQVR